jgi:hypothetical protein
MASGLWSGRNWKFLIALHGRASPNDDEWDEYCRLQANLEAPDDVRGFTVTLGGAPNRSQRVRLLEVHRGNGTSRDAVGSVVSDSAFVRGILATFTWLGLVQGLRSFSLIDFHEALDYIGVVRSEKDELVTYLSRIGDVLGDANPIRVALAQARRRA